MIVSAEDLAEERGDGVVAVALAGEDPADLGALVVGVRPVLDPAPAPEERVEEVGHVAGGVDAGRARLEALVDDDAVVDSEAAAGEKVRVRDDADADDGHVGLDAEAALDLHVLEVVVAAEAGDLLLEPDVDALRRGRAPAGRALSSARSRAGRTDRSRGGSR